MRLSVTASPLALPSRASSQQTTRTRRIATTHQPHAPVARANTQPPLDHEPLCPYRSLEEQTSAAASALEQQAERLMDEIARFKL